MGQLLAYSLMSGLVLLLLYLAYRLFLARNNQHGFNRGILLAIYLVSLLAPPAVHFIERPSQTPAQAAVVFDVGEAVFVPAGTEPVQMWSAVFLWLFLAGMALVFARTICTWIRLIAVIRSGRKVEKDGYTLVVTENGRLAPFSWIRYVVISRKDYQNSCQAIETHELKHISSLHWLDLLLAQAVCIINWFNPAAWLMRDELMLVHEYQADMAVLESGYNPGDYQMLLIKKAVGARFPSLANSLNHSKLKKRITMMYKEKSGAGQKFKALALVPMFAMAIGLASVPAVRAAADSIDKCSILPDKGSENLRQNKNTITTYKVTNINDNGRQTTVTINGEGLGNTLTVTGGTFSNKGKTYRAKSLQCNMTNGTATITATFMFSGKLANPAMSLNINGEEIPFNLANFTAGASSVVVGQSDDTTDPAKPAIVINGNSTKLPADTEIYLDGKKISESALKALAPEKIASISIDQSGSIMIISKK